MGRRSRSSHSDIMIPDLEDPLEADIPPTALKALEAARNAYTQREDAEQAILDALKLAPDNLSMRMAAYKFYFYANELQKALPHAEACLGMAAEVLQLPRDWQKVEPTSADFDSYERPQRVYLQSLFALGLCKVRLNDRDDGLALLLKAQSLDPSDKLDVAALLEVINRQDEE